MYPTIHPLSENRQPEFSLSEIEGILASSAQDLADVRPPKKKRYRRPPKSYLCKRTGMKIPLGNLRDSSSQFRRGVKGHYGAAGAKRQLLVVQAHLHVLRMRRNGMSFNQIGFVMGYSRQRARAVFLRYLDNSQELLYRSNTLLSQIRALAVAKSPKLWLARQIARFGKGGPSPERVRRWKAYHVYRLMSRRRKRRRPIGTEPAPLPPPTEQVSRVLAHEVRAAPGVQLPLFHMLDNSEPLPARA